MSQLAKHAQENKRLRAALKIAGHTIFDAIFTEDSIDTDEGWEALGEIRDAYIPKPANSEGKDNAPTPSNTI